jgi:hypothetical protein
VLEIHEHTMVPDRRFCKGARGEIHVHSSYSLGERKAKTQLSSCGRILHHKGLRCREEMGQ